MIQPNSPDDLDTEILPSEAKCARGSVLVWDPLKREYLVIPCMCKSWNCPDCAPRKQRALAEKLRAGRPYVAITLTARWDRFKTTVHEARRQKRAFHKLIQKIRKKYGWIEYAGVWELQKNGMPHVHVLARCPWIPWKWLSDTWRKLTGAWMVDIHRVGSLRYEADHSTKTLAQYEALQTYSPESLASKQTSQTAAALRPMRIVVFSRHYIDQAPGYVPEPEPPELNAKFTMASAEDIAQLVASKTIGTIHYPLHGHVIRIVPLAGIACPTPLQFLHGLQHHPP